MSKEKSTKSKNAAIKKEEIFANHIFKKKLFYILYSKRNYFIFYILKYKETRTTQ